MKFTPYFDCNATTPLELTVADKIRFYMEIEYGNAGSRTHEIGTRAKQAVQVARNQIASVIDCNAEEVIFTSGATESNNIAILGLMEFGEQNYKKHIISSAVEHKAVLDPLKYMQTKGWEVTFIKPNKQGIISTKDILSAVRDETLLISVMHVNNETGIIQPIEEIAAGLKNSDVYFHVDAAQSFGKLIDPLQNPRIDLISISAHKIYGPKGIGALITKRRCFKKPPLQPLLFGGGQERGLRPGTLPVPLIAGFGEAAEIARKNCMKRELTCMKMRKKLLQLIKEMNGQINGSTHHVMTHICNFSIPDINSEAVMLALKGIIAISNGSACTSSSYTQSHVLNAMGLSEDRIKGALRFSWCHMTEEPDWNQIATILKNLLLH
ncbi:MAG: cysteine desulfurase DndA [Victivallaceae bacterium]|nr:cysteine desulfurase DndA [Victivallaceae bacterium]